jgi:hypothetical protein
LSDGTRIEVLKSIVMIELRFFGFGPQVKSTWSDAFGGGDCNSLLGLTLA